MSQQQKRKYVRRKKTQEQEQLPVPSPSPSPSSTASLPTQSFKDITTIQDEEYEMSIMMDIIKMQEKEEKERLEKEKEKQIRDAKDFEEKIIHRDHNIKEMLRKLKLGNSTSSLETSIVTLLETTMVSQNMHIYIDEPLLFNEICCYLGIRDDNKKGTIRLPESVKNYAKQLFVLNHVQK